MLNIDRVAVHFRNDRIAAADREQRCDGEEGRQRGHHPRISSSYSGVAKRGADAHRHDHEQNERQRPMQLAMSEGPTAMTGAITAELLKVPLNRGRAILATVASINPAAAAAIPVSMRRSAGRSP